MPDQPKHSPEQREKWKLKKQRQRAKRAGQKAERKTEPPKPPTQALDVAATLRAIAEVVANAKQRRRDQRSPFDFPHFPPGVVNAVPADQRMPALAKGMALDESINWATSEFGAISQTAGYAYGLAQEGLTFLGYPYLAELSQRPEFRTFSEIISTEMTRKWIKFTSVGEEKEKRRKKAKDMDLEPDPADEPEAGDDDDQSEQIKELVDFMEHLQVQSRYKEVALQDGLFGRTHLYYDFGDMGDTERTTPIGGGRDKFSENKIAQGSLKGLSVIEPIWTYPTAYNATDPTQPGWYRPDVWYVMGKAFHRTRLVPFVSRPVPDILKPAYAFGGLSMTQMVKPYVDIWLTTREAVALLIKSFSVMVLSTDMQSFMQPGGAAEMLTRAELFNALRDNMGLFLVNKATEEFTNVSASLSGLHELQSQAQEHMMSIGRVPAVKYTGLSPQGMNASNEGEIRAFYDTIRAMQISLFKPGLTTTVDVAQLSLWGKRNEKIKWDFEELWEETSKERGDRQKAEGERDQIYVDLGALAPEEVRQRVIDDPQLPYGDLDPDDVPDLADEEEQGLEPEGGRPDPKAVGEEPGADDHALLPFAEDAEWNESEHPRAPDGKFGSGGGKQTIKAPQYGMPHGHFTATGFPSSSSASRSNIGEPLDVSRLEKVGAQKGSNPGGVYQNGEGKKFYVKQGKSKDHVRNEMIAAALYDLAGTPTLKYRPVEGGTHIATEMAKLDKDNASKLSKGERAEAARDFAVHAWLGNWDAVGLGGDNLGTVGGTPTALDLGGALEYRAQGAPKGKAFGNKVGELDTLRDPSMNKDAAAIFGGMTPAEVRESARYVTSIPDAKIIAAVEKQGGTKALAEKLIQRRDDIAERMKTFGADGEPADAESTVVIPAGGNLPVKELNGVKFKAWRPPADWAAVDGQVDLDEPAFEPPQGKQPASGVVIHEPDGRTWVVQPKGGYGGYEGTFPKGRLDKGLSMQANAIKEAYEESGLKVRITGFAGDHTGDVTHTRYYHAERESGDPTQHDDETEGVVLAPADKVGGFLNRKRDRAVLGMDEAAFEESKHPRDSDGKFAKTAGGGASGGSEEELSELAKQNSEFAQKLIGQAAAPKTYEEFKAKVDEMVDGGFPHATKELAKTYPEWAKKLAAEDPQAGGEMAIAEELTKSNFEGKTKKEIIGHLLTQEGGTTTAEILKETGWPSVSVPQQAAALGMKLEKFKEGGVTKYKATPLSEPEKLAAKAALELKKKEGTLAPKVEIPKAEPPPPPPPPPQKFPPPTAQELEKAKKNVALQLQYVPGANELQFSGGKEQAQKMVAEFNAKYAGKDLAGNQPALIQKVNDFKKMTENVKAILAVEKAHAKVLAEKEAAEAAKKAAAQKAKEEAAAKAAAAENKQYMDALGITEQEAYGFAALAKMMGGDAKAFVQNFKKYEDQAKGLGYPITGFQCALIKNYSDGGYTAINNALRAGSITEAQHVYTKMVNKALQAMPTYTGMLRRGTNLSHEQQALYQVGHVVEERAFTSTSISGGFSGNTTYRIKAIGKRGAHIKKLSNHPGEDEVLFSARTFFKVTKVEGKPGGAMVVHMEEMED